MTVMTWWEQPGLPSGYWIEHDATMTLLHRPDGSLVAAYNPMGADPAEIAAAAWEDAE
jgi:hypothetical protein